MGNALAKGHRKARHVVKREVVKGKEQWRVPQQIIQVDLYLHFLGQLSVLLRDDLVSLEGHFVGTYTNKTAHLVSVDIVCRTRTAALLVEGFAEGYHNAAKELAGAAIYNAAGTAYHYPCK